VPHLLLHRTSVFKAISKRLLILTSVCRDFGEGAITTYLKRLRFDAAGTSGARTHDPLDAKNTTTRLPKLVKMHNLPK
jgi:hypothetical protein